MRPDLSLLAAYFCCPDDGSPLVPGTAELECLTCSRCFPLKEESVIELLPSQPSSIPLAATAPEYRDAYLREFSRPLEFGKDARAWGAPEGLPSKWVHLRLRQAREALAFIGHNEKHSEEMFCDLSAGAGYCTFEAALNYRLVFHCDLSADSLTYAAAKAAKMRLENIVFVRADYFWPPFRGTIHHLVCLDTLIRGRWHETTLLRSIHAVLAPRGVAVVDFHNWWHNPFRRLGFFRDNFSGNKSYTRKELLEVLESAEIRGFQCSGFVQESDALRLAGQLLRRWIPPTRLVIRYEKESTFSR